MGIVKYNAYRDLRAVQDQMNRLLDLAWSRESGEDIREGLWQPAVDIYENAEAVVMKVEIPGVDQKDVEVKIEENMLVLRGERRQEESVQKENYHRIERYYGTFQRSFSLPSNIDQEKVKASYDKGVLTLTLPKRPENKPKQITVEIS